MRNRNKKKRTANQMNNVMIFSDHNKHCQRQQKIKRKNNDFHNYLEIPKTIKNFRIMETKRIEDRKKKNYCLFLNSFFSLSLCLTKSF